MIKFFSEGDYEQTIWLEEETGTLFIKDMSCTCKHGTIHRDAWRTAKAVCKHLRSATLKLRSETQES